MNDFLYQRVPFGFLEAAIYFSDGALSMLICMWLISTVPSEKPTCLPQHLPERPVFLSVKSYFNETSSSGAGYTEQRAMSLPRFFNSFLFIWLLTDTHYLVLITENGSADSHGQVSMSFKMLSFYDIQMPNCHRVYRINPRKRAVPAFGVWTPSIAFWLRSLRKAICSAGAAVAAVYATWRRLKRDLPGQLTRRKS